MSDVQAGALYQEIGTGTLYDVLDVRGATVRIRRTESPYSELELPTLTTSATSGH